MAAFLKASTSPEHSVTSTAKTSRRRHHGQGRPESRSRRPQSEHTYTHAHSPPHSRYNIRSSPPRQFQPYGQWCPSPITMTGSSPSSSAPSLTIPHDMAGITMERTPSGNSIMSDTPLSYSSHLNSNTLTCADSEAALKVEYHFSTSKRHSSSTRSHRKHHERILRKLIRRDDPLDDDALMGILTTADTLFFDGVLSTRVRWEWSSQERYRHELIGTTALRRCTDRDGFETLIVLSEPILRDPRYDRRLLLSAFLHELIHCYLFILCGFEARMQGGHTEGFHRIAAIIDSWAGEGYLSLCNMKANLNHFRRAEMVDESCGRGREWDVAGQRQYEPEEWCNQSPRSDGVGHLNPPGTTLGYV